MIQIQLNKENAITIIIIIAVIIIALNLDSISPSSISGKVVFRSLYGKAEYYNNPIKTELILMYPSENCPKSQFDLPTQKLITVKANEGVKVCVYPKTPIGIESVIYLYDHKPSIGPIGGRTPLQPNYLDDEIISGQGQYIKKPFSAEIEIDKSRTIEKIRDGHTTFYIGVLDKGVTAVTSQPIKVVE